jgi:hypothetical protein
MKFDVPLRNRNAKQVAKWAATSLTIACSICCVVPPSLASAGEKQLSLSPQAFAQIVADDITVRQALVTADFTRSIYSEACTFTDEVDTYKIDQYVSGTKALFNAQRSHVDLVGSVSASSDMASFNFNEKLTFNLPLNPYVLLTGRVELRRGPDGLVETSREFWDEKPLAVISTVKFDL